MRGTAPGRACPRTEARFSPAHAGNSAITHLPSRSRPVQPRACGEQSQPTDRTNYSIGSAPRMRGTVRQRAIRRDDVRFSPAHAGNSCGSINRRTHPSVQPRACGEQATVATVMRPSAGSAPRMRGTGHAAPDRSRLDRFSPAHAGNSRSRRREKSYVSVQPRACGEQAHDVAVEIVVDGSAPRMRGTGQHRNRYPEHARFSPAHAGNRT